MYLLVNLLPEQQVVQVLPVDYPGHLVRESVACETGLVQEVIKGIKAEDAQDVWISFGDGSQRTYTIKALTI